MLADISLAQQACRYWVAMCFIRKIDLQKLPAIYYTMHMQPSSPVACLTVHYQDHSVGDGLHFCFANYWIYSTEFILWLTTSYANFNSFYCDLLQGLEILGNARPSLLYVRVLLCMAAAASYQNV